MGRLGIGWCLLPPPGLLIASPMDVLTVWKQLVLCGGMPSARHVKAWEKNSLAPVWKDGPGEKLRGWGACLGKIMDCESVKPLTKLLELRFFSYSLSSNRNTDGAMLCL